MYPRATVELAKILSDPGILDRENATICGVSVGAVRKWRYGRRRDGSPPNRQDPPRCPRCHGRPLDERAYAYLLGLYLGDGHLILGKNGVWLLSITCCDGWPGLMEQAWLAMPAVMPAAKVFAAQERVVPTSRAHPSTGCACSRRMGLGGNTSARSSWNRGRSGSWRSIPVTSPAAFFTPTAVVRSTGSGGPVKDGDRWHEYPRYFFVNHSADILRLCGEALDQLEVMWRFSKPTTISVARRRSVARLDVFVGPKY
jgi:hypothetical protein